MIPLLTLLSKSGDTELCREQGPCAVGG